MIPSTDPAFPVVNKLLAQKRLTEDQLRIAWKEQSRRHRPIGQTLIELGFVTEATWQQALSRSQGTRSVNLQHSLADPKALELIPKALAHRHRAFPLRFDSAEARLCIAVTEPDNLAELDRLQAQLPAGITLDALMAPAAEIEEAIDRHYGYEFSINGIIHEMETGDIDPSAQKEKRSEYSQPVVRLINAILADAVKKGASDIHFEPEENFLRIRYRIDGTLLQTLALHRDYWPAMTVRLKVISAMNIAESRAPQDGRINLTIAGRPIDFRAASQPTLHGENIVLRILDRQKGIVPLNGLGIGDRQLAEITRMLARPEGMVLVTGPTGCGKTTTLYSILNHLNHEGVHIMTLEDPVEYPMEMIRQTSVAETANLDFANGIRSMMRQDPDIILVGEIRDRDTAAMAFSAAMTGHQVFSTLHTSSAAGALPRLLDLGIPPDLIAGNIIGIIAQRLLRRLCADCKREAAPDERERQILTQAGIAVPDKLTHANPGGCPRCHATGHHGRLAIMETLRITSRLDELIARRATPREILQLALTDGHRTLVAEGFQRVLEGETSLAELGRVVDLSEFL